MKTPQLLCGAIALATALAGCQSPATQADATKVATGVKVETQKLAARAGNQFADGWLSTKIQSKFVGDRDLKARDISVSSDHGVVTLKGRVENDSMRALAVAVAKNTDGVTQVVDQLTVLVAGPAQPPRAADPSAGAVATTGITDTARTTGAAEDGRITSSIQAKYFLDDRVKGRHIDVDTTSGIVTLRGEVGNETERAEALLLARTTEGVTRVEDNLTVTAIQPDPEAGTPAGSTPGAGAAAQQPAARDNDAALTARIQSQLSADGQAKAARIDVMAKNGVVLLEGTAPSTSAKQRVLTLARGVDGVTQIVDRIRVGRATK